MLPLSTNKPVRFTPARYGERKDAPVYLVEVPSLLRKAELQRDVAAAGGEYRSPEAMRDLLRDCIEEIVNESDKPALIEAIDVYEALLAEANPPADQFKQATIDLTRIEASIKAHHPTYRAAVAQQGFVASLMPLLATQMFLIGYDGDEPLPRTFGKVDDDAIRKIPDSDIVAIGAHALKLSRLDGDLEKNSESPSSTPSDQTSSGRSAKNRQTAKGGSSTGKSTKKTRAS